MKRDGSIIRIFPLILAAAILLQSCSQTGSTGSSGTTTSAQQSNVDADNAAAVYADAGKVTKKQIIDFATGTWTYTGASGQNSDVGNAMDPNSWWWRVTVQSNGLVTVQRALPTSSEWGVVGTDTFELTPKSGKYTNTGEVWYGFSGDSAACLFTINKDGTLTLIFDGDTRHELQHHDSPFTAVQSNFSSTSVGTSPEDNQNASNKVSSTPEPAPVVNTNKDSEPVHGNGEGEEERYALMHPAPRNLATAKTPADLLKQKLSFPEFTDAVRGHYKPGSLAEDISESTTQGHSDITFLFSTDPATGDAPFFIYARDVIQDAITNGTPCKLDPAKYDYYRGTDVSAQINILSDYLMRRTDMYDMNGKQAIKQGYADLCTNTMHRTANTNKRPAAVTPIAASLDAATSASPRDIAAGSDLSYGNRPDPKYPPQAVREHHTGTVVLVVLVGLDGSPKSVTVEKSSGFRELDRSAMDAVQHWRFNPEVKNGKKVEGYARVPANFNLAGR